MKTEIHPKVYINTVVTCACGNTFETISTLPSINVDICSNCHPLFTGQQKFVDTEGRIEKFAKKTKQIEVEKQKHEEIRKTKKTRTEKSKEMTQVSLKDMLKQLREDEQKDTTAAEEVTLPESEK